MVFNAWLNDDDYSVAGFSYGAIKAFEHVLTSTQRIDTLQLFSPAFFQDRTAAFRRTQMLGYRKDPAEYVRLFTELCFKPLAPQGTLQRTSTRAEELQELLAYVWDTEALQRVCDRGISVEVYLGGSDAVIDAAAAREFFTPYATVFYINSANHFLKESENE